MTNHRSYLPPEQVDLRIALYEDGYPIREIARMEGVTHQAVRFWLMRRGIHEPEPYRPRDLSRAIEWYCGGYPIAMICRHFRISAATLYKAIRDTGNVPLRYPKISVARSKPGKDGRQ